MQVLGATGRSAPSLGHQAANAERTSSGRSAATKSRTRGAGASSAISRAPRSPSRTRGIAQLTLAGHAVPLAQQQPPQQVHRHRRRPVAHRRPPARQLHACAVSEPAIGVGDAEAHGPDRLLLACPPPGPGDAGDADADVGAEARAAPRRPAPPPPRARPRRARSISSGSTPASADLGLVRVGDHAAQHVRRGARRGRSAAPPAGRRCTTRPRDGRAGGRAAAPRPARRSSSRRRRTACRAWRARDAVLEARRSRPPRLGLEARRDLDLPAAQAGRDLQPRRAARPSRLGDAQRRGDLGLRDAEQPQHALRYSRAPATAARSASVSAAVVPHRLQLARRARAAPPPSGRSPVAGGTTSPGAVPTGSRTVAPSGTTACLRLPRADRLLVEVAPARAAAARGSPRCAPRAPRRGPSRGPRSRATTSAVRSSAVGPEAAAGDDQVHALARPGSAARRACPRGRSPTITMWASSTPELAQPLGQPRPVAVGDDAR